MIYTVTLNPALDYNLYLENMTEGEVNRVKKSALCFGGKGINVSYVLKELGAETTALGFVASFTGDYLEKSLEEAGINTDFIHLKSGMTRINVKIKAQKETDLNATGPDINKESLSKLTDKISLLNSEDILCLSGSVPKNCDEDIYSRIMEITAEKGIKTVVDAEGKLLLNCLKYKPFLVKPNAAELEGIFETRISGEKDIIKHATKLYQMGAQNVVVSCGKDGAFLVCEQGIFKAASPKGNAVNTVGAGDSLVAGFIAAACKNAPPKESLALGVAAGSATAFSETLATRQKILDLSAKIGIIKL